MNPWRIYEGSDGEETRQLYNLLTAKGPIGIIALNLFRAQKCSARAKIYRRRMHSSSAYDRKEFSLRQLCTALAEHPQIGFAWGWGEDKTQPVYRAVLFVDLPTGQASFHAKTALTTKRYAGQWDGTGGTAARILHFVQSVLD